MDKTYPVDKVLLDKSRWQSFKELMEKTDGRQEERILQERITQAGKPKSSSEE